jgi:hypothetical protein
VTSLGGASAPQVRWPGSAPAGKAGNVLFVLALVWKCECECVCPESAPTQKSGQYIVCAFMWKCGCVCVNSGSAPIVHK